VQPDRIMAVLDQKLPQDPKPQQRVPKT